MTIQINSIKFLKYRKSPKNLKKKKRKLYPAPFINHPYHLKLVQLWFPHPSPFSIPNNFSCNHRFCHRFAPNEPIPRDDDQLSNVSLVPSLLFVGVSISSNPFLLRLEVSLRKKSLIFGTDINAMT